MKKIKKTLYLFIALLMCLEPIKLIAEANNSNQIVNTGGETVGDGVKVSKTIEPTELENYFDITLKVQTKEEAKSQDLAVVLVMDISNTMIENKVDGNQKTRLRSAMDAGEYLINNFTKNSLNSTAKRKIGYVAFNSNANQIFALQECKNTETANNLISSMKTQTKKLVKDIDNLNYSYKNDHSRFTNIEAGLKMAYNMLYGNAETKNIENKYVIVLSDGFPTTYDQTDYKGYDTYDTTGRFYDHVKNRKCLYGTDYSEEGARRAQIQATKLKNSGTIIYAVGSGIDANAKTIDDYFNGHKNDSFSTIDRYDTNYAIGNTLNDFKRWLGGTGNTAKPGIGSGYSGHYFDATDTASLKVAYDKIFEDTKYLSEASWVAEDPMNSNQSTIKDVIDFVGLYDKSNDKNKLKDFITYDSSLTDIENTSNNTANYNSTDDKINWDLKKSKYQKETVGNTTYYNYEIKYRVRLKNETTDFIENQILDTNGKTTLSYVVRESGKNPRIETIDFKIPQVKGYLGKLEFNKLSNYGNKPLTGAKFVLVHDHDNCPCKNERKYMDKNYQQTSTSNEEGKVIFTNIPSGHKYKLKEVETDKYHDINTSEYQVTVSYGNTKTNITDNQIVNNYKTKELTIMKIIEGNISNKEFIFEIEATYQGTPLVGTYSVQRKLGTTIKTENIEFINGKSTFKLKHNEQIKISGLPYETKYKIKEINREGFIVKYQVDGRTSKIFDGSNLEELILEDNMEVKFINTSGYLLPATGSSSMLILVIIGTFSLGIPIIYTAFNVLKKRLIIKH
ncbi:MAG: SpaA isopeptide-forming pilin-related protein [Bacilli bacterium]